MEAELVDELPEADGWQYEPKWDGFRGILENVTGELHLWSRNGRPLLRYFPELEGLGKKLKPNSAVDGEIVVEREGGLDFDALQMRLHPAESRVRKLSAEIPAQFVAFDRAGNVYTTDVALDRIQKFTPEGKLLAFWGTESSDPGGFGPPPKNKDGSPGMGGPIALCVDREDRVWVSATNNRVQQFTNDGKYLRGIGGAGDEPGQFHLPHGVALDSHDCLYVTDTMNGRIQKFATD